MFAVPRHDLDWNLSDNMIDLNLLPSVTHTIVKSNWLYGSVLNKSSIGVKKTHSSSGCAIIISIRSPGLIYFTIIFAMLTSRLAPRLGARAAFYSALVHEHFNFPKNVGSLDKNDPTVG